MAKVIGLLFNLSFIIFCSFLVYSQFKSVIYPKGLKYSTFEPRFCAPFVDSLILWPISTLLVLLPNLKFPVSLFIPIYFALSSAQWIYSVFMHAKYGQTVGKMTSKIKVVDFKTENKIGLKQALLRDSFPIIFSIVLISYEVLLMIMGKIDPSQISEPEYLGKMEHFWYLGGISIIWFFLEMVTMFTNKKRRALHDFIAGTVVIRTNIAE